MSATERRGAMQLTLTKIACLYTCTIFVAYLTSVPGAEEPKQVHAAVVNENTATYSARPGTKTARYFGSVACIAPDYVLEVLEKPSKAEKFVLEHECVQRAAEPVVLYQEKGKYVSLIMFPKTGTQMYVASTSIK
ncbi:p48 [Xanthomonas phage Xop411]|uniref:p48 n=1 Tax=Xanthomonas phage Xop411 TaxID=2913975 RepID=A5H1J0_9CAUD|nr:p48 [Xanthomonas phage Xop411]ABK00194.2 p48 [Xanthomonas phage Xop411]